MKIVTISRMFRFFWQAFTEQFLAKCIGVWLAVGSLLLWLHPTRELNLEFADIVSLPAVLGGAVGGFLLVSALQGLFKRLRFTEWFLLGSLSCFSVTLLLRECKIEIYLFLALFLALAVLYAIRSPERRHLTWTKTSFAISLAMIVAAFFACTLIMAIFRYRSYGSPNFDFGIFSNMFHYMRTTFLPNTTCERDILLSHFAIHISPIFYLLLPVYMVFPSPMTLIVSQVVLLYSGVIPLLLMARHRRIARTDQVLLTVIYSALPAIGSTVSYDIHENTFLLPLILWMLFFYEKKNNIGLILMALAVCLVKEDAFMYVAVFAVYLLSDHRDWKHGLPLFVGSFLYFMAAIFLLQTYGEGVMSDRFSNLIANDSGLIGIIRTVFMNPGYTLKQVTTGAEGESPKLVYLAELLIPLAFLPLRSRKFSRLILLAPVVLNLITDYSYLHDIRFQYTLGIVALLLYVSLLTLSEMSEDRRRRNAAVAAALAVLMFVMTVLSSTVYWVDNYRNNRGVYRTMDEVLADIPEDASVTASAFLVPQLSQRNKIYEVYYHGNPSTDYLVLDLRGGYTEEVQEQVQPYLMANFICIQEVPDVVAVYASPREMARLSGKV